jgi:hypothetical protein
MNSTWIGAFVESVINAGDDWQSYKLTSDKQENPYSPLIVQVGVGIGHDTCELTDIIKRKYYDGKLIAIDWFQGNITVEKETLVDNHNYTDDDTKVDERYQSVVKILNNKGNEDGNYQYDPFEVTTLIKGNSHDELAKLEDESVDLLFIDGGHEYSCVKKDIELGWEKIKPGGYICGDDYTGDYYINNIEEVSEEDLEKDHIDGVAYLSVMTPNGTYAYCPCIHAGVIKAVHQFFDGKASVNNYGRYWYYRKPEKL